MGQSGLSSIGTTFKVDSTTIAQVYSISGPGLSKDTPETTDLSNTYRTYASGMKDGGEISVGLRWIPGDTTHQASASAGMLYFFDTGVVSATITFPNASSWAASCYVTAFEPTVDIDSPLDASVTLKVTGTPSLT